MYLGLLPAQHLLLTCQPSLQSLESFCFWLFVLLLLFCFGFKPRHTHPKVLRQSSLPKGCCTMLFRARPLPKLIKDF